jgi:hypothetical protein
MGETQSVAEISSFFGASISIIFGIWNEAIAGALSAKMPIQQRDRKPYVDRLLRAAFARLIPLWVLLVAYVLAFGGKFLELILKRELAGIYGGDRGIDEAASVFCLIYLLMCYLAVTTGWQGVSVVRKLLAARKQRPAATPRAQHLRNAS